MESWNPNKQLKAVWINKFGNWMNFHLVILLQIKSGNPSLEKCLFHGMISARVMLTKL